MSIKVSVITVCFNSEETIEDTLKSVAEQTYKNIELIVIDGYSIDNTINIIKGYVSKIKILKILSEKDKGIYDAMNKGLAMATGEIIGFLNSDDFFADKFVVSNIAKHFQKYRSDCCYSNIKMIQKNNVSKTVRNWICSDFYPHLLNFGWLPPHPGFYITRNIANLIGNFNLNYKIQSDVDFMLRILLVPNLKISYLNIYAVNMRMGGESNGSLRNILKGNQEAYLIYKNLGFRLPFAIVIFKFLRKIPQYFK